MLCSRPGRTTARPVMDSGNGWFAVPLSPSRPCDIRLHILQATDYRIFMKGRNRKTLEAVFRDPVSGTIEWTAVEGLLIAAGARVIEGRGSRVRFEKNDEVETFHRPHPAREAKRYQIRAARAFLKRIGVAP